VSCRQGIDRVHRDSSIPEKEWKYEKKGEIGRGRLLPQSILALSFSRIGIILFLNTPPHAEPQDYALLAINFLIQDE
jgi:hypothetical protein